MYKLPKSALLTLAPHVHVDITVSPVLARVFGVLCDRPPEESLAAFTSCTKQTHSHRAIHNSFRVKCWT